MAETPFTHADVDAPRSLLAAEFDRSRFRLTLGEVGRRLVSASVTLLAAVLVVVMFDHTLRGGLPVPVIRALGGVLGVAAAGLGGWAVLVALRRLNPVFVARWLERSRGVANNVVVNWLLVQHDRSGAYAGDAAISQAARELAAPSGDVEAVRRSPAPLVAFAAVSGAWVLFGVLTPKPILTSIERLFGASVDVPSATRIRLVSPAPGESLHVGEPATIVFAIEGRGAGTLEFELLADNSPQAPVALARTAEPVPAAGDSRLGPAGADLRCVTLAANEVSREITFRARAGDAAIRGTIPVLPRPDIVSMQVRLTPPAYVNEPEEIANSPDITVWAGTRAEFSFRANTEIRGPVFVLRGETESRTRMNLTGERRDGASASMLLIDGGDYWLEFSDATGRPYADPPPHRISVRTDQPPRIALAEPLPDAAAADARPVDVTRVAWVKATASDDVRLASVTLALERVGRGVHRRELLAGAAPPPNEGVTVGVATGDLDLAPGESARIWFEARDTRRLHDDSPAPQISATTPIVVTRSKLAPPIIPEKPKVAPPNGEPGENAAVGQRPRGTGQGESGEASGDGAGDNPGGPGGEPGGSYSDSPKGESADTGGEGGIPDPSANGGQAEEQSGKPNAASGGDMAGGESDDKQGGLGDGEGEGSGEGSGGGEARAFENELKRFVEKNGDAATEAKEALDRSAERQDSPPSGEEPAAAEPSEKPLPDDGPKPEAKAEPPASQAANPGDSAPDSPPARNEPAEPKPEASPKTPPAESQPAPSGDAAPPPDQPSDAPAPEPAPQENTERQGNQDSNSQPQAPESKQEGTEPGPPETGEKPEIAPSPEGKVEGENPPAPEPDLPEMNDPGARSASPDAPAMPGTAPEPADTPSPADRTDQSGERPGDQPKRVAEPTPGGDVQPRSELVNTLDLLERADELDEESLQDLPWPIEKKRAFLTELKRLAAAARQSGVINDLKRWRSRATLGETAVQRGAGLAEGASVRSGETSLQKDLLERAVPPNEQKISPALRAALDAYYRSLAAQRSSADPGKRTAP